MSDGRLPVRRRWIGWTVGIVLTVLIISIGWVTIRGIAAVGDLQQVSDGASELKSALADGDLDGAEPIAAAIARDAASARDLTADPVWQAFSVIPWLGPNFHAVSEVARVADEVAGEALTPLLGAMADFSLADLGFSDGTLDLTPFAVIEAPLGEASTALTDAQHRAEDIDADATVAPLGDAVREMRGAVNEAATVVGALHGASVLLPTMLGGEEPRDYVLAMQNNAELRSSGGIVGSIALLHAENGKVTLQKQASTRDFPALDTPLPVSESTTALFEEQPGRYLQNITSIPDFAEAGATIAERWTGRFGGEIDGVVAVDAVVAKHLLAATGDLRFGPFTATPTTVLSILLSDIYAAFPDPAVQDDVFAQAASGLFRAALSGGDARALVGALATSSEEGRIRIWSAHEDEQRVLAASDLGGSIPDDEDDRAHVGVLINDTTGGKMDYYTEAEITLATGVCDAQPTTQVRVTWTNGAPSDAATSLPEYVTAAGWYGVPAGSVRTLIAVYGPDGATASHIDRDGEEEAVQTAVLDGRSAVQHEVLLAPGESSTITVEFQGDGAGVRLTELMHTPMIDEPKVERIPLRCAS